MTMDKSMIGRTPARRRDGFTLVEMLLVLTILAILAGIVLPNIATKAERARVTAAKTEVATLASALNEYEIDNGSYPRTSDGLQALIVKPHGGSDTWKGPYLQKNKVPVDPWKNPYVYEVPGKHNPAFFDVYSKGKDGVGGKDAIGNWED
jgi:general secretion pathway protein G